MLHGQAAGLFRGAGPGDRRAIKPEWIGWGAMPVRTVSDRVARRDGGRASERRCRYGASTLSKEENSSSSEKLSSGV